MNTLYCRRAGDLLGDYGTASCEGRRAFALAEAQPHYAPDRLWDVVHIALTVQLDMAQQSLRGTCATTVRATSAIATLTLDAVDLQITQVRRAKGTQLAYDYDGRRLRIPLDTPLHSGEETTVEVEYSVTKPRLGLYFITPDAAYPGKPVQVWTQCQDEDARYWFPCFDAPNEKATTALALALPQGEQRVKVRIHEHSHAFHVILPAKPQWLSFDPGNWILKKLQLKLPKDMLLAQLHHDPDIMDRIYAAEALAELGSSDAVAALRQALEQDPFWAVQAEVARLLGSMHTPAALDALVANVHLAHAKARRAVVTALGEFKEDQAATTLHTVLQAGDASYFVEAEAAAALGKTRRDSAFTPLQEASARTSWNEVVRSGVFRGLADLRDERAIALLRDFTAYGQPPQARYAAIRALGTLGGEKEPAPETIVETLTTLLDEDSFRTRMTVLDALTALHSPKTLGALERLRSRDLDGRVQRRVAEVIEALRSNRKHVDELHKLRDDVDGLREQNKKLQERLDRFEAQHSAGAQ